MKSIPRSAKEDRSSLLRGFGFSYCTEKEQDGLFNLQNQHKVVPVLVNRPTNVRHAPLGSIRTSTHSSANNNDMSSASLPSFQTRKSPSFGLLGEKVKNRPKRGNNKRNGATRACGNNRYTSCSHSIGMTCNLSLRRMAYEILAMRDDFLFRDVQEEFDFCLGSDAETGMIVARWGGREDDKPDAADVRWLRGHSWHDCERWPTKRSGWRGNWSVERGAATKEPMIMIRCPAESGSQRGGITLRCLASLPR